MSIRRSTSAETAARFAAMYKPRRRYRMPYNRTRSPRPTLPEAPGPDRIVINFGRATLGEILSALCERISDGHDTQITRIAEDMIRSALEYRP